jgi:hypothetical protein
LMSAKFRENKLYKMADTSFCVLCFVR